MPKKRGLIVDDDKKIAQALQTKFNAVDFKTVLCHNGAEAIEAVRGCPFAFILLDLALPEADGFEILRQLPETTNAATPVFVLTGHFDRCDAAKAAGAHECFIKPQCDLGDVVRGVQAAVS